MKVRCVDPMGWGDGYLTLGKEYEASACPDGHWLVAADNSMVITVGPHRFVPVGVTPEAAENPQSDPVNHPTHYTSSPSGVECIDVVEHMPFNVGAAVKYCWRAGLKSPDAVTDLKKAVWFLNREIQRLENKGKAK